MLQTLLNKISNFDEFAAVLGRNIKNDLRLMVEDYRKVLRVIKSCKCEEHLDASNKLITYFNIKHKNDFGLRKN